MLVIAAAIAVISIVNSRHIARKKQSIDMLMDMRCDKLMNDALATISKLHNNDEGLRKFAQPSNRASEEAEHLRLALNHFEYIAVGIRSGIYDEILVKDGIYTTIVDTFFKTEPYIKAVRQVTNRETIYQDFECLARRWDNKKLQKRKPRN